ncbi:protein GRINL1A [Nematolebias whitei]|uniref:protein GRINL1A n=1 Tax=Nematolebias whitei TaxID=451745 RepID=UPI00189878BC|nr:protein GRINL1A [Nematolebias whitei]
MSSSWTDRQGQVGDLRNQSKEELQELLLRQEKILSNKRLLQTLPDKGNKIKDFVGKVRLAIEQRREEERRQSSVSATRSELQSKYQRAFQHRAVSDTSADSHQNEQRDEAGDEAMQDREASPVSVLAQEDAALDTRQDRCVPGAADAETMDTAAAGVPLSAEETKDELSEALERVALSEAGVGESKDQTDNEAKDNYFLQKQTPKKPHYVSVLEKTETSTAPRRQKFKPNQLPHRSDASPSRSVSPAQSSGAASPVSAQARREQDRKHLDDVTAARLPPLHHSPAQLLSLEESAVLVREQTKKHEEHLSIVSYTIKCEHLPTQVRYNNKWQSGGDSDEDDEHSDELP